MLPNPLTSRCVYLSMRYFFSLLLCLYATLGQAQEVQWQAKLLLPDGHFEDRIFMAKLGNQMAVVYLSQPNGSSIPEITLGVLDDCGQTLTTHSLTEAGFVPFRINDIANDAQGNLYICGISDAPQPDGKIFILKLDTQLNLLWAREYSNQTVYPYSFEINQDNELFLLFNTQGNTHGNSLLKLNSNGQVIWAKSFGYSPIWGMGGPTSDGGFIHTTGTRIFKTNSNGNMLWRIYVSGSHIISPPIEIANGYMLFQGYPNASNTSRVIMLNMDGTLRWASKGFRNFNAFHGEKLNTNEVLFTGHGQSQHSSAPSDRSLGLLRINTLGQITGTTLLQNSGEKLLGLGLDVASNTTGKNLIVERKLINNTENYLVFTRFPQYLDSLSCYPTFPFEEPQTTAVQDTSFPLIPSKNMSFNQQSLQLQLGPPTLYNLNISCQKSAAGTAFNLGNDTILCPGEVLLLKGPPNHNYRWSTGQISQSISVSEAGWYSLSTQYGCDTTTFTDSIYVDYYPQLELDIRFNATTYYVGDTLFAEAFGAPTPNYRWFLNGVEVAVGKYYNQLCTTPGQHTLRIVFESASGCTFKLERDFIVEQRIPKVPNVFSPNGDGINDLFDLHDTKGINYRMQVYNRYGALIAETENAGWDGRTRLNLIAAEGVYFYLIYWDGGSEPFKGHLTLVR